ncbi:hypothetical protein BDZ89DRAFT_664807 [Hymenopellis radicata]|nr:hypothetical protein BDZ89DRAFT_664807 [Hymenopellis radicata]
MWAQQSILHARRILGRGPLSALRSISAVCGAPQDDGDKLCSVHFHGRQSYQPIPPPPTSSSPSSLYPSRPSLLTPNLRPARSPFSRPTTKQLPVTRPTLPQTFSLYQLFSPRHPSPRLSPTLLHTRTWSSRSLITTTPTPGALVVTASDGGRSISFVTARPSWTGARCTQS